MKTIHILEVETGNEAHALRAAAEYWGADVSVTWVGNSAQIVDYLSSSPPHDLVIISAHGGPAALLLPELHESIRHKYPYNEKITADQFREFVKLNGTPVLNLSCEAGSPALAHAFLDCGAGVYIGPAGGPEGSAALMYALEFLYACLVRHKTPTQAHETASNHSDDRSMFRIYSNEHAHSADTDKRAAEERPGMRSL